MLFHFLLLSQFCRLPGRGREAVVKGGKAARPAEEGAPGAPGSAGGAQPSRLPGAAQREPPSPASLLKNPGLAVRQLTHFRFNKKIWKWPLYQALLWVEAYQSKWMNPCHGPSYLNMSWKRLCSLLERIWRMRRPRAHVLLEHLRPAHLAFAEHQHIIIQHCPWSQTAACGQNILILMEMDTSVPLVNQ